MVERSKRLLPHFKEGDNVLVGVNQFDNGRGDLINLIKGVMNIDVEKHKLGIKYGLIENLFERNSLNKKYNTLKIMDDLQIEMSIRTLVSLESVGTCQGYNRCHCTHGCKTA